MISVLPADTYTLISRAILTDEDRKILTMLYQPIIGSIATNLYFTFWSQLDKKETLKEYNHYHLMINMGLNLDNILEAREKLEGIGLIKSYISKDDQSLKNFIYEIYSPLNAFEFISSPLLSTLLINNIGEEDYNKIIKLFQNDTFDLSNYKEITKPFSKVFRMSNDNILNNLETNIKKNTKNNIQLEDVIDISNIISLIPDEMLNKKSITKDMINTINNLVFVYNLTEEDIKDIIINSIDISHKIDKEKLKINSRHFYEFNHSGKKTSLIYKTEPDNLKSNNLDISNINKMIYTFENTTPYDFLASKYKSGIPTKTDLKILEYLLDTLSFTPGVVNVLIDYVLKTNDNKLTKSYIETVAGQWKRSNIDTVKKAVELAKKENAKRKVFKNKQKIIEVAPDWMNKDIKSVIASQEEQEEMVKALKELVGE